VAVTAACLPHKRQIAAVDARQTRVSTRVSTCVSTRCQVFILDALSTYRTDNPKDAEAIIERVTPRLQHANSAVVLSAVKVR